MGIVSTPKTVLTEYINPGQSQMMADQVEKFTKDGQKEKHWYLRGIFLQGEVQNLNGRIYPRYEIENAVKSLQEQIQKHGSVLGELDHPDTLVINVDKVSHCIDEIRMEGNNGIGKMKILSKVPRGKIVEGLLEEGIPLGVSSRGSGNVDEYTSKVSDFEIITIDIVATPSAQDARPTPIYEKFQGVKSQHLLNNAQDFIIGNSKKHKDALNEDIISWFKQWSYK